MRGWEGEVRVRVRVARKGSLLGVTLDHSSGYEILDKHALAMLEGLGGLPALPEGFGPWSVSRSSSSGRPSSPPVAGSLSEGVLR